MFHIFPYPSTKGRSEDDFSNKNNNEFENVTNFFIFLWKKNHSIITVPIER